MRSKSFGIGQRSVALSTICFICLSGFLTLWTPSPAFAKSSSRSDAQEACERLAAPIPLVDPQTKGPGIDFTLINPSQAIPACHDAVRSSDLRYVALYSIALRAGRQYPEAIKQAKRAAEEGNAIAMVNMGEIYRSGAGVPQSETDGAAWYTKAAEAGNPFAMGMLGEWYLEGNGVAQDNAQAAIWLRRGADAGNPNAMENLGYAYEYGIGVPKSFEEAATWYRKASDVGYAPTIASASTHLGYLYEYGRGVTRDYAESAKFYRKAAEGGDAGGMSHLGTLYQTGHGVPRSFSDAAFYYQKAVDLHYDAAALYLGVLYQNGWGVQKDLNRARSLFNQASTSKKPQIASAATKLGDLLQEPVSTSAGSDGAANWDKKFAALILLAALASSNNSGVGGAAGFQTAPQNSEDNSSVCMAKAFGLFDGDGFAAGYMRGQASAAGCWP
jgi:TPR repeat protein